MTFQELRLENFTNPLLIDVVFAAVIGALLHVFIKARELKLTTTKHNIEFKFREYFVGDWLSHIISILVIMLYILFINKRLDHITLNLYEILLATSATVGYSGDHLASKFFSASTKKIESAIDYKTSLADKASGTTDAPTPK